MSPKRIIRLTVNGDRHEIAVGATETLNQVIRDGLRLTGTKRGCTSGSCGVCTVNDERGREGGGGPGTDLPGGTAVCLPATLAGPCAPAFIQKVASKVS